MFHCSHRLPNYCHPASSPAAAGHSLLKKKADALNMRFRQILRKIVETKEEMGKVMKVGGPWVPASGAGSSGGMAGVQDDAGRRRIDGKADLV